MGSNTHDQALMEILKEDKTIVNFLDSIFGFLFRCTDFYHLQSESSPNIGFHPGMANQVVQHMFQRYEKQARLEEQAARLGNISTNDDSVPAAAQEVELVADSVNPEVRSAPKESRKDKQDDVGEHYNGDDRGSYKWSQSIRDIDLVVLVTDEVQKANQLKVNIEPLHLKIENLSEGAWHILLDQSFPHKVAVEDCIWSLVPGERIQVSLEKKEERWWDRLFLSDPAINVTKLDTARPASDLSQEEHMKIEELIVGQERRHTSSLGPVERTIEAAWNQDDSPFRGQPLDANSVQYLPR